MGKNDSFTYFNLLILCMWPKVINEVKVTHQDEGHIKVKVKYLHPFKFYVAHTLFKQMVCIRLKCYLLSYVESKAMEKIHESINCGESHDKF